MVGLPNLQKISFVSLFLYTTKNFNHPTYLIWPFQDFMSNLFSFMKELGLKALKKNGAPENDNGETGP